MAHDPEWNPYTALGDVLANRTLDEVLGRFGGIRHRSILG